MDEQIMKFNFLSFRHTDALQLSIPTQGLANGDAAALPHTAYPGIQPFPGVGEFYSLFLFKLKIKFIININSMWLCCNV